jgi:hypothetical protein
MQNPELYQLCLKYATEARPPKVSMRLVMGRARWDLMQQYGRAPMVNNNLLAEYARFLMDTQPSLRGKFNTRRDGGQEDE